MAYTKQNFVKDQVLEAEHLNHIEEGIVANETELSNKQPKGDYLTKHQSIKTINGQSVVGTGNLEVSANQYAGLVGKTVSFLGDSITTFKGYIPSGYAAFYPHSTSDITEVEQTWWHQFVTISGMTLHQNCSWSGSYLTGESAGTTAAAGCSTVRVNNLAKDGVAPDMIIIMIGINDFYGGKAVGDWVGGDIPDDGTISTMSEGYALLMYKILTAYPKAEVFICTLPECGGGGNDSKTLKEFNECIHMVAESFGVHVLDMHACGMTYYNRTNYLPDNLHPNAAGARLLAKRALSDVTAMSKYMHPLPADSEDDETTEDDGTEDSGDDTNTDIEVDTTTRVTTNSNASGIPVDATAETNLWETSTKIAGYCETNGTWYTSGSIYSIIIPVLPGDKVYSNSFGAKGDNGGTASGITVAFFKGDTFVSAIAYGTVYSDHYLVNGYVTVPDEDIDCMVVPQWVDDENSVVNILNIGEESTDSGDDSGEDEEEVTVTTPTETTWYVEDGHTYASSSSGTAVNLYGFRYDEDKEDLFRNKTINAIYLTVKTAGTLTLYRQTADGTTELIETLNITETGSQEVALTTPVVIGTDEHLIFGETTDTCVFSYASSSLCSDKFYYNAQTNATSYTGSIGISVGYVVE